VNGPLSRIATFITDQLKLQTMVRISNPIHAARCGWCVIEDCARPLQKPLQDSFVWADSPNPGVRYAAANEFGPGL
jgi:hypothetical protein